MRSSIVVDESEGMNTALNMVPNDSFRELLMAE